MILPVLFFRSSLMLFSLFEPTTGWGCCYGAFVGHYMPYDSSDGLISELRLWFLLESTAACSLACHFYPFTIWVIIQSISLWFCKVFTLLGLSCLERLLGTSLSISLTICLSISSGWHCASGCGWWWLSTIFFSSLRLLTLQSISSLPHSLLCIIFLPSWTFSASFHVPYL